MRETDLTRRVWQLENQVTLLLWLVLIPAGLAAPVATAYFIRDVMGWDPLVAAYMALISFVATVVRLGNYLDKRAP